MFIPTLDCNQTKVAQFAAELAKIKNRDYAASALARKEIASGLGDFNQLSVAEAHFIDLAVHQDAFLDDAAVQQDVGPGVPIYWTSEYAPTVGASMASVYGSAPATIYQTTNNYATLTSFPFEAEEVKVPKFSLTQDIAKLHLREKGLERQAEALKLLYMRFIINTMLGQPLGLDIPTSVTNYWGGTPYSGKNVYVLDPGVQSTSVETTNVIDASAELGITMSFLEQVQAQAMLMGRKVRTIHIPVAGQPWRKLLRSATIVANQSVFGAGVLPNAGLKALPEENWKQLFDMNLNAGKSFTLPLFGELWKFKANNVLPQGYCIITTDQPAVALYNILEQSVSTDIVDPRDSYFEGHYEKRQIALVQPDPWLRNFMVAKFGNTTNL